MTKDDFERFLRQYLDHQPFQPFVVQLRDGQRVVIMQRPVVFCDGAASFIDPTDGALVEFFHDDVLAFNQLAQEISA